MGGFGVKVQHFPLTLLVVLTTLTLPCERDLQWLSIKNICQVYERLDDVRRYVVGR